MRRIYTVISVWPQECPVSTVNAYRELQTSKGPTFHGAGRTHSVSPSGDNSGDSVRTRVVTTRQDRHYNLCHHSPPRRDRASNDEDNGQGSPYFAQNPPALASSSRKALHLKALGLLCGTLFLSHACIALHGRPCGSEKDRVAQDQLHPSRLIALSLTYHSKLQRANAHATLSISLKSMELRLIASSFLLSYHTLL